MSLNRVSPPVAGTWTACRMAPIEGTSRQVTSWCQPFSKPPVSTPFSKRTSSGWSELPVMNGWISSSPNRRAKATCWAGVIGWPRNTSTL